MSKEVHEGPTPHNGVKAVVEYQDAQGNEVDKSVATHALIQEYDVKGRSIYRTYGTVTPQQSEAALAHEEGGWITIGGHPDGTGQMHVGGFPVQVGRDGTILKGRLKGTKVKDVKKRFDSMPSDDHRSKFIKTLDQPETPKTSVQQTPAQQVQPPIAPPTVQQTPTPIIPAQQSHPIADPAFEAKKEAVKAATTEAHAKGADPEREKEKKFEDQKKAVVEAVAEKIAKPKPQPRKFGGRSSSKDETVSIESSEPTKPEDKKQNALKIAIKRKEELDTELVKATNEQVDLYFASIEAKGELQAASKKAYQEAVERTESIKKANADAKEEIARLEQDLAKVEAKSDIKPKNLAIISQEDFQKTISKKGMQATLKLMQNRAAPVEDFIQRSHVSKKSGDSEKMKGVTVGNITYQWAEGTENVVLQTIVEIHAVKIPTKLQEATSSLTFTNQPGIDNDYWSKKYNMIMEGGASGGDGKITVYEGKSARSGTITHEMGHNLAIKIWDSFTPPSDSDYGKAQKEESPVTSYGAKEPAEDFAEAVSLYVTKPKLLARDFPKKYAAIKELLS